MGAGAAGGIPGQRIDVSLEAMKEVAKDTAAELKAETAASKKSAQAMNAQTAFRARAPRSKKSLKARARTVTKLMKMKKEKRLLPVERIKSAADKHSRKNPELKAKVLQLLRERVKPDFKREDIEKTLEEFYPDPTLADDAYDFLLETTEGELHQQVQEAKDKLHEEKEREIVAGRNISTEAREASDKGLGTPTALRDMYRDITGNPRDANSLFDEFSRQYAFKELQKVIKFFLHSLGADMKSKGPSIARGELHRLLSETRTMQAILGVYRFFKKRMALMQKLFSKGGLQMPSKLTFELMAKSFMSLVRERYPSGDKVLSEARRLGIEDWILAKIIAFSQFRDSVRELAMSKIYRSLQHRDDLLMAIIEALEELEDKLEEMEEEEEEEQEEEEEEEQEEEGRQ